MREAIVTIADVRDSERLRQFARTGVDREWFIVLRGVLLRTLQRATFARPSGLICPEV